MPRHINSAPPGRIPTLDQECRVNHSPQGNSSNSLDTLYQRNTYDVGSSRSTSSSSMDRDDISSAGSVSSSLDDSERSQSPPAPTNAQSELRKQIIKIQTDSSIPPGEKAKRIQV
jgi:hypothetical protein